MRLILTVALFLFIVTTNAGAAGYKSDYCDNQEYYTNSGANDGSTYPHLHCNKKWIAYSKSGGQHYNFADGNGVLKGKANSSCNAATEQDAGNLKAKIKEICDDDNKTCDDCE